MENKLYFVLYDFNLNCLGHNKNLNFEHFTIEFFFHGCIPFITRPIRVASKAAFLLDKIVTNLIFDTSLNL